MVVIENTATGLSPIGEFLVRLTNQKHSARSNADRARGEATSAVDRRTFEANAEYYAGQVHQIEQIADAMQRAGIINRAEWLAVLHQYKTVNGVDVNGFGDVAERQWLADELHKED